MGLENCKLETVAKALEVENPRAHRALADALTTARIFLKLQVMETPQEELSLDDLLDDLDDW